MQQAIVSLGSVVGAEVTNAWGFSDELTEIVKSWSDLTVLPKEAHYIDFIRAGAVHYGLFKSEKTCEALLNSYVKKGILPNGDYMETDEFGVEVAAVRTMFS